MDVVVVGGGISGLACAHFAARSGRSVVLVEARQQVGGCIHTASYGDGFWAELGAHTCYNSYGAVLGLLQELRLREHLVAREKAPYRLLEAGRMQSIAAAMHWFELGRSLPRLARIKKSGHSVRGYYEPLVGRRNYAGWLRPMLCAVPSQNVDDFPADALFKKRTRQKDAPRSFTVKGGLRTLVEALAKTPGVQLHAGRSVQDIVRTGGGYLVETSTGEAITATQLVVATPPPSAARLLRHVAPTLSRLLRQMNTVAVETVGVAIRSERLALPRVAGIVPAGEDIFFSVVSRDVIPHGAFRGFAFHFRPGVSREEKAQRIAEVLGVSQPDLGNVAEWRHELPSLSVGHGAWLVELRAKMQDPSIGLVGNYFAGLSLEDCVQRARGEARRMGFATAAADLDASE